MTQGSPTATLFVLLFLMGFGEKMSLHFKETVILELSQVNFMENHALMPRAYKPCKPVARKGTQNLQCNRCNTFF